MTRDLAAVAVINDRRRCHISTAPNVELDETSTPIMNCITMSSSTSSGDIGTVDGGSSPKSSSVLSTMSSSMSSDDDECPMKTEKSYRCHKLLSSIHNQKLDDHNNLDKDSSSGSRNNDSTSIEGRLTFYKGK